MGESVNLNISVNKVKLNLSRTFSLSDNKDKY